MFIERLTDYEIEMFIKDAQSLYARKITRHKNEIMVLAPDFETAFGNKNTCAHLSDFHADIETTEATSYALNVQWKNFMLEKFGEEYKKAFNDNLKAQHDQDLIK